MKAWLAKLARHPVITGVLVACILAGGLAGGLWLDADWSLSRRVLAGAVGGAWVGLLFTATKIVGQ